MTNTHSTIPTVRVINGEQVEVDYTIGDGRIRRPRVAIAGYQSTDTVREWLDEMIAHTYLLGVEQATVTTADLDQQHAQPMGVGVPTVEPFAGHSAATIYRDEANFNVIEWVPAGGTPRSADQLSAALRGALADAFHAGRREAEALASIPAPGSIDQVINDYDRYRSDAERRIAELEDQVRVTTINFESMQASARQADADVAAAAQRIENLERQVLDAEAMTTDERVTRLQAEMAEKDNRIVALEQRITALQDQQQAFEADWDTMASMLLQEAEDRNWCSDYEAFVGRVNSHTRRYDLYTRDHDYMLTVTADMQLDGDDIPGEPNWTPDIEVNVDGYVSVTFTTNVSCSESAVDSELADFRSAIYEMSRVVRITDTNYDQS